MASTSGHRVAWAVLLALSLSAAACGGSLRSSRGDGGGRRFRCDGGVATWYGPGLQGNRTASGEPFDMNRLTAAHPWLPFGTRVRVTNLRTGRHVTVRINDRGPAGGGRCDIDLSRAAARRLGILGSGRGRVRLEVVGPG